MKYILSIILGITLFTAPILAQEETPSIDSLCNDLYHSSNRYAEGETIYRVVRWSKMSVFFDDIKALDAKKTVSIEDSHKEIEKLKKEVKSQEGAYAKLNNEYKHAIKLKDGIEFFSLIIPKAKYNLMMWSIIVILIVVLIVFYLMFKRANQVAKQAKNDLDEKIEEFESYRQRSLRREQEVSSSYLREINKLKEQLKM